MSLHDDWAERAGLHRRIATLEAHSDELHRELEQVERERDEAREIIALALQKMLPVYEGTDNMETAMLLDRMVSASWARATNFDASRGGESDG